MCILPAPPNLKATLNPLFLLGVNPMDKSMINISSGGASVDKTPTNIGGVVHEVGVSSSLHK